MAKRRKWEDVVNVRFVDYGVDYKCNPIKQATSTLLGGLFLGAYGAVRAYDKNRGKYYDTVTIEFTYSDGYVRTETNRVNGGLHNYAKMLKAELEAKNSN